jgi:hypothetical protein
VIQLFALVLLTAPIAPSSAPKIAAAPLDCIDMDAAACRLVEDLVLAAFSQDQRFEAVISGQDLKNLLSLEQQRLAVGCAQTSCLAELGQALEVGHLLTIKLGKIGGQITLSFTILDTRAAEVAIRRQKLVERLDSLPKVIDEMVRSGLDQFFAELGIAKTTKAKRQKSQGQAEGIAVFDLEAVYGVKASMARVLSDILLSNLTDSGRFLSVVSAEDIKQMLDLEQQKNVLGCQDDSCMAEIGGALGVPFMAVPSMGRLGGQFVLNLKILDVEAARVRARVSRTVQREVDLPAAVLGLTKVALEHLFEGAATVRSRVATQRMKRLLMHGTGLTLMAGAAGAFGYSIVEYHQALDTYLSDMNTLNYDEFQSVRQRVRMTRLVGLVALTTSLVLAALSPPSPTAE